MGFKSGPECLREPYSLMIRFIYSHMHRPNCRGDRAGILTENIAQDVRSSSNLFNIKLNRIPVTQSQGRLVIGISMRYENQNLRVIQYPSQAEPDMFHERFVCFMGHPEITSKKRNPCGIGIGQLEHLLECKHIISRL